MENIIKIVRTRKCRKSDVIIKFLIENNIPHEIKFVESDPEAQEIYKTFNIKASPGIIVNDVSVNPYGLVEKCKIKDSGKVRRMFEELLVSGE